MGPTPPKRSLLAFVYFTLAMEYDVRLAVDPPSPCDSMTVDLPVLLEKYGTDFLKPDLARMVGQPAEAIRDDSRFEARVTTAAWRAAPMRIRAAVLARCATKISFRCTRPRWLRRRRDEDSDDYLRERHPARFHED
jgi:hypothetical protein